MPRLRKGQNDLLTMFPSVAAQAYEWNPADYAAQSHKRLLWKCEQGHVWEAKIYNRTQNNRGCPFCSGRNAIKGVNDLKTLHPSLAEEADGWDPSEYLAGSGQKKQWKCKCGHTWIAAIHKRALSGTGCPRCKGKLVTKGKNDLASLRPEIAREACGWDPELISINSARKLRWKCSLGHEWESQVSNRVNQNSKCPFCAENCLVPGVNDLQSKFPLIAQEAYDWDPSLVRFGSVKRLKWQCNCGNIFIATPNNRTKPHRATSCPLCKESGYRKEKDGWMYLMEKEDEQQFGITNKPSQRISFHKSKGWKLIELRGPASGCLVAEIEKQMKRWLKKNDLRVKGTHENWSKDKLLVTSLQEISMLSGVDSLLFSQLS